MHKKLHIYIDIYISVPAMFTFSQCTHLFAICTHAKKSMYTVFILLFQNFTQHCYTFGAIVLIASNI